jgi:hypothetical protein
MPSNTGDAETQPPVRTDTVAFLKDSSNLDTNMKLGTKGI